MDNKKRRPPKAARQVKAGVVILIVLAVALLIGGAALAYSLLKEDKKPAEVTEAAVSQTAKVPDVVGKPYEEAKALLEKDGLKSVKEESYSADIAKGSVITQYIKPGETVEKGSVIKLLVSLGKKASAEPTEKAATAGSSSTPSSSSADSDKGANSSPGRNDAGAAEEYDDNGGSGSSNSGGSVSSAGRSSYSVSSAEDYPGSPSSAGGDEPDYGGGAQAAPDQAVEAVQE